MGGKWQRRIVGRADFKLLVSGAGLDGVPGAAPSNRVYFSSYRPV